MLEIKLRPPLNFEIGKNLLFALSQDTSIQASRTPSKELRIVNTIEGSDKVTTLRLDSIEEMQKWSKHLANHAKDHFRWKHAAETVQYVPCVESVRNSYVRNSKRQGSLYDETPLIGESGSHMYKPSTWLWAYLLQMPR